MGARGRSPDAMARRKSSPLPERARAASSEGSCQLIVSVRSVMSARGH